MDNPRAVIGNNSSGLEDAIARFDLVGYLLVRHETLMRAAMDDRIDRACLKVLGMLIATMNRETRTSWAGREYISDCIGLTPKSISNYIYQLKGLGYIVAERRQTPQAGNRVLMHYTLSKLSPEEIETAIENAISSIKGDRNPVVKFPSPQEVKPESSRPDRNSPSTVPVLTGTQVPVPAGTRETSRPDGNEIARSDRNSDPKTAESSRPDGHSNIDSLSTTKNRTSGDRGTGKEPDPVAATAKKEKLKADRKTSFEYSRDFHVWCGRYALDQYVISKEQAQAEFKKFVNAHTAKGNKFVCWKAAWRTWMSRDWKPYTRRQNVESELDVLPFDQKTHVEAAHDAEKRKREEEQLAAEGWEIARGDP